ncbi:MAG TPA: helix-turn-helix domain-containing protein [Kribbella sp.]
MRARPVSSSGRYLSLHERLRIADLLRLGCSMRAIAVELGAQPFDDQTRAGPPARRAGPLPAADRGSRRTSTASPAREHKLLANPRLRKLVQRKLNRCWSPDEISGWLRLTYPNTPVMWLCPETIYRALLVPGGQGLHKRYCHRLRTGREQHRQLRLGLSPHWERPADDP